MSRHITKQSLYKLFVFVVFVCSCFNVYLFCIYLKKYTFLRAVDLHIQLRSNSSNHVKEARQSLQNKSIAEINSTEVKVSVTGSRDVLVRRTKSHVKSRKDCIEASTTVKKGYISKLRTIVNPHHVNVTLSAEKVCKSEVPPYMLIVSLSLPSHFEMRETIRRTWASSARPEENSKRTALLFIVGQTISSDNQTLLSEESDKYGDILQGNFREEYSLITRKVLMGMKWMMDNCKNTKYFLKVDEDVFVNLLQLLELLTHLEGQSAIIGYHHATGRVFRVGNWGVTFEQFKFCHYLPYVEGNSYVISGKLVAPLLNISQYHPYMATEDAYITGILREMIGAKIHADRRFATPAKKLKTRDKNTLKGFFNSKMISETRCTIHDMKQLWSVKTELNKNR